MDMQLVSDLNERALMSLSDSQVHDGDENAENIPIALTCVGDDRSRTCGRASSARWALCPMHTCYLS